MGKIRIKTLGDEEKEKKQKQEAKARKEAKKLEEKQAIAAEESKEIEEPKAKGEEPHKGTTFSEGSLSAKSEEKTPEKEKLSEAKSASGGKEKKEKFKKTQEQTRSTKYQSVATLVDRTKTYSIQDASELLPKLTVSKFDETVELHVNTTESGISGKLNLPHGTGKKVRVAIADPSSDAAGTDTLLKKIEAGTIDFDILLASPDAMPKLARVARILGPRGLMPNPKNGTVTKNPKDAAKQYESGQVNFKTEAKFPLLHLTVGKVSFGPKKLEENITAALKTVSVKNIKNVTLKSTMSPGIKLQISSL